MSSDQQQHVILNEREGSYAKRCFGYAPGSGQTGVQAEAKILRHDAFAPLRRRLRMT